MERSPAPVVNPGQRLGRLEARREKLLVDIHRTRTRWEKTDKAAQRAMRALVKLERQLVRMDKTIARAKVEAANELVETAKPETLGESCDQIVSEMIQGKTFEEADKPKRKRKAKANGDALDPDVLDKNIKADLQAANDRLADAWNASLGPKNILPAKGGEPSAEQVKAERAKRMKAMGFHPTKR